VFKNKSLISILDLNVTQINAILDEAQLLKRWPDTSALKDKIIACCFFEASTRTRLSFETATYRLGGNVTGFSDAEHTSFGKKGESLEDTIRMVSQYSDAIVIRHPESGSAFKAASVATVPVINAGDGANQHPTQTLLDLFTIREAHGRIDDLKIILSGDLKYSRTIHSLVHALALYENIQLFLVASEALQLPEALCHELTARGVRYSKHETLEEVLPEADVIYMTRIQKERMNDHVDYKPIVLDARMLKHAKPTACVLHPLPRQEELDCSVDPTPYAKYFEQAANGVYVRQALLKMILS